MTGKELYYIAQSVSSGKISGDGMFTKKCHQFFEEKYNFKKALLTTSCTDALEMAAILLNIQPGDEVIMPSYTFVSTANAFVLRGAKIVFADSGKENPNIDVDHIAALITPKTKAIVVVHYAGIACDMDRIAELVSAHNIYLIEDAAQAIDSFHNGKPLGSFGHLAAFSFHETKNIISGEGGMLVINDDEFVKRAEIIREKGTNRSAFFRGEIDKYGWVDIGSSFLPSDVIAAFLYAQLENLEQIQSKRKHIWELYHRLLQPLATAGKIVLPHLPTYATNNAHMFYIVTHSISERENIISELKKNDILSVFHYISLHKSEFYKGYNPEIAASSLPMCDHYSDCLLRLPFYYELTDEDVTRICAIISSVYQ